MRPNIFLLSKVFACAIIFLMVTSGFGLLPFMAGGDDHGSNETGTRADEYDQDIFIDDIKVNDYFIVPGIHANKHYPGQNVNITTRIWNLGTKSIITPFDILMVILDDVQETDVKYEVHLKKTVKSIGPRSTVNLSWSWQPPGTPPAGAEWDYENDNGHAFKCRVISLFDGDQNSSNNYNSSQIDIDNPKFEPSLTNTVWEDYGVVDTPLLQTIPIGSILYLNFTVNNSANTQDFIKVEVFDLPPDWVVLPGSLPDFLQLQGLKGSDVRLRIQISRDNSLALKAHDYAINIRAYSLFSPPRQATFQFTVNLMYSPLAKFIMPKDITLKPGSHLVDVTLMNIGNGRDIFTTTAEVFPASTDWGATVYSGKKTKLLKTFETTTVTIRVDVPPKRKDSYKTIIVTAHSVQQPTYNTQDEYRFKIYVGQYHGVGMKLSEEVVTPLRMSPVDEYSFEMIVTNTGNTKDPTIELTVTDHPENWEITLETSNIPKSGLGIGVDVDVGVLIKTPKIVLMGDYTITISGLAGPTKIVYDELTIPVTIIEVGEVSVEARPPAQTGDIGDIVQYKIFIKNTGNRLDTFDISMEELTPGMQGWGKLSQNAVTLDSNSSYEIVLTVTIPLNASADTNPNTPSVWEGYDIGIYIRSQNLSYVARSVIVTTSVERFYDFDLSADATIKPFVRGNTKSKEFLIKVKNRGNVKDTFRYTLDTDYKWPNTRLRSQYKTIKPDQELDVQFEVDPPDNIGVGVYDFTILVTSSGDPEKFRVITLKVFISSLELSISNVLVDGDIPTETGELLSIPAGNTVLVTAQIKNTGSVSFENSSFDEDDYVPLDVVFFDGRTTIGRDTIEYLPVKGTTNISVTWNTTLVTQDITLFVNLDPNDRIQFSSRTNLSLSAKIHIQGEDTESEIDTGPSIGEYIEPFLVIIVLVILQVYAIAFIARKKKERVKVGYTEDGEYKPFADVFDPFSQDARLPGDEEHPYRLAGAPTGDKISITTSDRPILPPATFSVKVTRPIIRTKPLPKTNPVKRRKKK